MLTLADISALRLWGVYDRGVANKERIVLRAWDVAPVQLGHFILGIGWAGPGGAMATPFRDNSLWLGELLVRPEQWVFVYTGPGESRTVKSTTGEDLIVMHWNRETVLFTDPNVTPMLMQMSAVAVGRTPDSMMRPILGLTERPYKNTK